MTWGLKRRNEKEYAPASYRRDADRFFDDFFSLSPWAGFDSQWLPNVDVDENEKEYLVSAELPGMDEKDIDVTLEKNILTISGEKKSEKEEKDDKSKTYYAERHYGSFRRSIALPEGVKADKVKASFKKGILSITIPKDEAARPQKIAIDVN